MIAITLTQFLIIAFTGVIALMGIGMLVIISQHRNKQGNPSKEFMKRIGLK